MKLTKFVVRSVYSFALLFTSLGFSENKVTANVNIAKFTTKQADHAVFRCGYLLVNNVHSIPSCNNDPGSCWGGSNNQNDFTMESIDNENTVMKLKFGIVVSLRSSRGPNDDYIFELESHSADLLALSFKESVYIRPGEYRTNSASLITLSPMPYLEFQRKEIRDCKVDRWGNEKCNPSRFEYLNINWILPSRYTHTTSWKNRISNQTLNIKSDFKNFISCVENKLK